MDASRGGMVPGVFGGRMMSPLTGATGVPSLSKLRLVSGCLVPCLGLRLVMAGDGLG